METTSKLSPAEINDLIADTDNLINQAETFLALERGGNRYKLGEWLTIRDYAKKFGLPNTMVVTNWIARGIVPPENILELPELNDIRLIRAVPYRDA
jgi:hypothetical protein